MATTKPGAIQRDWVSKTFAGVLLGLFLAFLCSAIFARLAGGLPPPVKVQLTMWMVTPIWLTVLGSCYLFENGKRAWLWLGAANLLLGGLLAAARLL